MCTFVSFSCRRSSISALIGVKVDRMGLMGFLVVNYSAFQLCNVFILARKDITCNRQKEQANNFLFCSLVDDHRYRRWLVWKWVGWVSWEKPPTSNPPGSFVTGQKKTFWFGTIFWNVLILQITTESYNITQMRQYSDLWHKSPKDTHQYIRNEHSPVRYVLKIHFFIESGLKMIQFKIQFKTKIQNIH